MLTLRSSAAAAGSDRVAARVALMRSLRMRSCPFLVSVGDEASRRRDRRRGWGRPAKTAGLGVTEGGYLPTPLLTAPAGLLAAGFLRVGIGFFPLRDRTRFVVRHLVVHAGAVREHDRRGLAL